MVDRVAGALAIEPRDPFMDRRLIRLALRLPAGMMMREGWPKYVLRLAAPRPLPDAVRWRRGRAHPCRHDAEANDDIRRNGAPTDQDYSLFSTTVTS